ncbi:hypothetical protein JZ751_019046 [Albula glossodonta]|uniref:Uncharacterized protein n=1 Tax=Albula glossodonta TaxID=121402 RepID=A0A8T2NQS2_9TELE|nr:hypothetical protein JZ751_019046 [Albula glossodonta]
MIESDCKSMLIAGLPWLQAATPLTQDSFVFSLLSAIEWLELARWTSDRLSLATEEGRVQPVSTDTDSHRGTIWSNASTKKNRSWRTEHHQPPSTSSSRVLVSIQRARHGEYSSAR